MQKYLLFIILFGTLSSCMYGINPDLYTKENLLLGLELERSKINDVKEIDLNAALYISIAKSKSKLTDKWYFVPLDIKKLHIPGLESYHLIVSTSGVVRGVRLNMKKNKFAELSKNFVARYSTVEPYYSDLQTFIDGNDVIELTYSNNNKSTVVDITSKQLRQERIENYKVSARKGNALHQRILKTLNINY